MMSFLNYRKIFSEWDDMTYGALWAYNLNYMDFLNQAVMDFVEGKKWIDSFIDGLSKNKIGLDPYPIALRGVNWIKFMSNYFEKVDGETIKRWNQSLYSQYRLLSRRLELHLLGNHLLEDLLSLYIASIYFKNNCFYNKSKKMLIRELNRQILDDGAHFEQSTMYHCVLLDRLLDCYNFSKHNDVFVGQSFMTELIARYAIRMLGHLDSVIYSDGTIPLVNDSAYQIAPTPHELFDYARRLGINWSPIPLSDCGYRRFKNERIEGIIDIGDIKASYQPGHSHADTFSYELRIDGDPFIVDSGISTYEKNERRQYERSTVAHNTVAINGQNSSDVWGGFRMGSRASVTIIKDSPCGVKAFHDGFGKNRLHTREFNIYNVIDEISEGSEGVSYIHFAPNIHDISLKENIIMTSKANIVIEGYSKIELASDFTSVEYNSLNAGTVAKIFFSKRMKYHFVLSN